MRRINILGTEYEVINQTVSDNPKLEDANGLCEFYTKQIIVDVVKPDRRTFDNLDAFNKRVYRHEIIHAFLGESGLKDYASDEVLVDWIAVQFPKIAKVFAELGVED